MKIAIASDLHLEFQEKRDLIPTYQRWKDHLIEEEVDLILLAGDTSVRRNNVSQKHRSRLFAESLARDVGCPVVFIAGNHEYYKMNTKSCLESLRKVDENTPEGVYFLENDLIEIRDNEIEESLYIIGATLWTDFKLYDHPVLSMNYAEHGMNDFKLIRNAGYTKIKPQDTVIWHNYSKALIEKYLLELKEEKTLVLTHHCPSSLVANPLFKHSELEPAYISEILSESTRLPDYWVFGHSHHKVDQKFGKTRIITHQRGYPGELEDFDEFLFKIIEV